MSLEQLIVDASNDSLNPRKNFEIAVEYEKLGQTASAVGFYLRAAEYGHDIEPMVVYSSLLKVSICAERQGSRPHTVSNAILQAMAYLPDRPEAYFLLSKFYEKEASWQECYTYAKLGIATLDKSKEELPIDINNYHKNYALDFQVAISAWWIGRKDESIQTLLRLDRQNLSHDYEIAVKNNLRRIGGGTQEIDPLEPVITNYRKFFGADAPVIIDIGTRDGDDAKYLSDGLNGSTVVAIDASPIAVELTKNLHPWMLVIYSAVSDFNGETIFHQVNSNNKELNGCSSIASKENSMYPEDFVGVIEQIKVPVTRMDSLLDKLKINEIVDVVKIDVEGFSAQVISGFGDRLSDIKLLHVETEFIPIHDAHVLTAEVTSFMRDRGFVLVDVSYEWGPGIQDQIWVNSKLATHHLEFFQFNHFLE